MNKILVDIINVNIKSRSFKSEILSGKKKLPFKYIVPYLGSDFDNSRLISAYADYLYKYEFEKFKKDLDSKQMSIFDFLYL